MGVDEPDRIGGGSGMKGAAGFAPLRYEPGTTETAGIPGRAGAYCRYSMIDGVRITAVTAADALKTGLVAEVTVTVLTI